MFLLPIVLNACLNNWKTDDYTKTSSGLMYKLCAIGDGDKRASFGDFLQLLVTYKTMNDSVFYDSYSHNISGKVILPFNQISFKGSFEEHLKDMNEGDSVSFIVNTDSLFLKFFKADVPFFLKNNPTLKIDVKLHKILNNEDYKKELERYSELIEDADIEEARRLNVFLETTADKYTKTSSGVYFLPVKQGTGGFPEMGNRVKVNFKGSFLNGKLLESTYDRMQPFEFIIGEQGQVIKGLEISIKMLNEGAQAKFIIPSHLAYGNMGSSTGIVPPYTTLIYEIELIKIIK